jgi:hypothetical protein
MGVSSMIELNLRMDGIFLGTLVSSVTYDVRR